MKTTKNAATARDKMRSYRAGLRAAGLRRVYIWVPDIRRPGLAEEARRQSLLASGCPSDREALAFIGDAADTGNQQ